MKIVKRFLVSLMATAVSASSLSVIPSVSAASGKYKTYSYFFDVPANTYVKICNANTSYNPNNVEFVRKGKEKFVNSADLGGTFNVSNIGVTDSLKRTYIEYSNASPTNKEGNLGYVTLKTTSTIPSFSVTLVKNDRGNTLVTSTVKVNRVLMGDVNLDGIVDVKDVELLNKACMGTASLNKSQLRAADVDGNNQFDSTDSLNILKYVQGIKDSVCD